ncbi:MAG: nucleotidyltransferase domain-containing protein [Myxococcota bacterium]
MSELAPQIAEVLAARPESIAAAWLFGSHAEGRARADSDVDVAVLFAQDPPRTLDGLGLDIAGDLEQVLDRPVDLVVLNRVPIDLVRVVMSSGVLIYEGESSRRIAFEVRARADYFDLKPFLDRYREPPGRLR